MGFERSEQNNLNGCFGTVTEDFCETLHKIKSKTLSKNQERIPLSAKKREASSFEGALLLFRENTNGIRTQ